MIAEHKARALAAALHPRARVSCETRPLTRRRYDLAVWVGDVAYGYGDSPAEAWDSAARRLREAAAARMEYINSLETQRRALSHALLVYDGEGES